MQNWGLGYCWIYFLALYDDSSMTWTFQNFQTMNRSVMRVLQSSFPLSLIIQNPRITLRVETNFLSLKGAFPLKDDALF